MTSLNTERRIKLLEYEPVCGLCKQPVEEKDATLDHIIPRSHGGTSRWDNLQLAHRECNEIKADTIYGAIASCIRCERILRGKALTSHWKQARHP